MTKFLKNHLLITAILILAAALRLVNLQSNPIGFNDDEAAFGYNAYSIIKTGMDEWGRFMPFPAFESFGDWKLSGYLYLVVISEAILGPNVFAARLPSALIGIAAVYATYLLTKELFKRERNAKAYGLMAAFLLTISPWHIIASRNAFESDILIFTITISLFFFLKSLEQKAYLKYALIGFVASFYIYRSAWIFLPLFSIILCLIYKEKLTGQWRQSLLRYVVIVGLIPIAFLVLSFKGQSRFIQESFITGIPRVGINNEINEKVGICQNHLPYLLCRITYNKYLVLTSTYISNYIQNLSLKTYFDKAHPLGFQSFSQRSLFYTFELPLLLTGGLVLIITRSKNAKLLFAWLAFVPIAASVAGVGNFGRLNIIMPAPQIIEAYGLIFIFTQLKQKPLKKVLIFSAAFIMTFSVAKFLVDSFYIEPVYTSRYQRYGYERLFGYLNAKEKNYSKIIISRQIDNSHQYIQHAFFQKVDPSYFQNNARRYRGRDGWIVFDNIGKYFFVANISDVVLEPNTLVAAGQGEVRGQRSIYQIRDVKGDIIFEIYDSNEIINYMQANREKTIN